MDPMNLKAKLVMCNIPTVNFEVARKFYSTLLGKNDFVRALNEEVEAYYQPISEDGLNLNITQRYDDLEQITCYFAVDQLDEAIQQLQAAGGKVLVEPMEIPISGPQESIDFANAEMERLGMRPVQQVGRMATLRDPDGNHIGLLELQEFAQRYFQTGKS